MLLVVVHGGIYMFLKRRASVHEHVCHARTFGKIKRPALQRRGAVLEATFFPMNGGCVNRASRLALRAPCNEGALLEERAEPGLHSTAGMLSTRDGGGESGNVGACAQPI